MRCTSPIMVLDKSTGGVMANIPCGRCLSCRLNRAAMWSVRIVHEAREYDYTAMWTLTYKPECLPARGSLVVRHVQDFVRALRKQLPDIKIRYYISGEYGENYARPHYHAILFGVPFEARPQIERCWHYGAVHALALNRNVAQYVAAYCVKKQIGRTSGVYEARGLVPEFSVMSRRPGIGMSYVERWRDWMRESGHVNVDGVRLPLPRYYRERVYTTEEERAIVRIISEEAAAERLAAEMEAAKLPPGAEGYVISARQIGRRQSATDLAIRQRNKRRTL